MPPRSWVATLRHFPRAPPDRRIAAASARFDRSLGRTPELLVYIARRLAWTVIVILMVLLITFLIFFELPAGDTAARFAGRNPSEQTLALIRERLRLDDPVHVQFGAFVQRFVTGDEHGWPGVGYSYSGNVSVRDQLIERAPRTLWLIFGAATIWLVLGVAVGVLSAVRRRTAVDRAAMGFALFGISAPGFWLGLVALFVFWRTLHWTGGTGYVPLTEDPAGWFSHLILPWAVLSVAFIAIYARLTRNNLLETLGEDYIRTARAKGLPERTVILRHGLRASMAPIVTMFGLDIALLVGGTVIIEDVFNIQGLGWLTINSTLGHDLPTVLGVVVISATAVAIMNLVVDIAYAFLDPRVRYG